MDLMIIYPTHVIFVGVAGALGATMVYPIDMGEYSTISSNLTTPTF